jgi:hypothetical protein
MKAIAIIVMHDMFLASNKGLLLWNQTSIQQQQNSNNSFNNILAQESQSLT